MVAAAFTSLRLPRSNLPRSKAGAFLCELDRRRAKASKTLNDIRGPLRLPLATKPKPSPARPAGNPGVAHIVHALRALPSTGSLGHGRGRPCRHCFLLLSRLQNSATRRASWAIGRTSGSSCAKAAAGIYSGLNWILHKRKAGFTFPHVRRLAERRQPRSLAPISREAAQKRQFVGDELNFGTWLGAKRHGFFQRCIGEKFLG